LKLHNQIQIHYVERAYRSTYIDDLHYVFRIPGSGTTYVDIAGVVAQPSPQFYADTIFLTKDPAADAAAAAAAQAAAEAAAAQAAAEAAEAQAAAEAAAAQAAAEATHLVVIVNYGGSFGYRTFLIPISEIVTHSDGSYEHPPTGLLVTPPEAKVHPVAQTTKTELNTYLTSIGVPSITRDAAGNELPENIYVLQLKSPFAGGKRKNKTRAKKQRRKRYTRRR